MKRSTTLTLLALLLAQATPGLAMDGHDMTHVAPGSPTTLMNGMGNHRHAIHTASPEAQRFFDQGLTLVFAFNHEEAIRSFQRAAALDSTAAMPWWGIALALGPNINLPTDADREREAYAAVQKARSLLSDGQEEERGYVEALATRYAIEPTADRKALDQAYAQAMGALTMRFPDDLDAATLYAEAMMDLRPWQLWSLDGKPAPGTEEIVAVLESVLKRDPYHPGANHYYIHAVEASPNPERALPCATRLETLVPNAGHLVHMPSHVYIRVGDYASAAKSNQVAAELDRRYIESTQAQGVYPLMYYGHNVHFLAVAFGIEGRYEDAKREAVRLAAHVAPAIKDMPMAEPWMALPLLTDLRFHQWKAILKTTDPGPSMPVTRAIRLFARGAALAEGGRVPQALRERAAFQAAVAKVPADALISLNLAASVLRMASLELDARLAETQRNMDLAIEFWRSAVQAQDSLAYDEPPVWYHPIRESLGRALLRASRDGEAEAVFREDLTKNPKNGRSLFGLTRALEAQGKGPDADATRREFEIAWKSADRALRLEDL